MNKIDTYLTKQISSGRRYFSNGSLMEYPDDFGDTEEFYYINSGGTYHGEFAKCFKSYAGTYIKVMNLFDSREMVVNWIDMLELLAKREISIFNANRSHIKGFNYVKS